MFGSTVAEFKMSEDDEFIIVSKNKPDITFTQKARQYLFQCMAEVNPISISPSLLNRIYEFFDNIVNMDQMDNFVQNYYTKPDEAKFIVWLLKKYYISILFRCRDKLNYNKYRIGVVLSNFCRIEFPELESVNYEWYHVIGANKIGKSCKTLILAELASANDFPDKLSAAIKELIDNEIEDNQRFDAALKLIEFQFILAFKELFKIYSNDNKKSGIFVEFMSYAIDYMMSSINFNSNDYSHFIDCFKIFLLVMYNENQFSNEFLDKYLENENDEIKMMILLETAAKITNENELAEILYKKAFIYLENIKLDYIDLKRVYLFNYNSRPVTVENIADFYYKFLLLRSKTRSSELLIDDKYFHRLLKESSRYAALLFHLGCVSAAQGKYFPQCFEILLPNFSNNDEVYLILKCQLSWCYFKLGNAKFEELVTEILSPEQYKNLDRERCAKILLDFAKNFEIDDWHIASRFSEQARACSDSKSIEGKYVKFNIILLTIHMHKGNLRDAIQVMEKWLKKESSEKNLANRFLAYLKLLSSYISVDLQMTLITLLILKQIKSGSSVDATLKTVLKLHERNFSKQSFENIYNFATYFYQKGYFENAEQCLTVLVNTMEMNKTASRVLIYVCLVEAINAFHDYKKLENAIPLILRAYKIALDRDGFIFAAPPIFNLQSDMTVDYIFNRLEHIYHYINTEKIIFPQLKNLFNSPDRSVQFFNNLYFSYYQNRKKIRAEELELLKITWEYLERAFIHTFNYNEDSDICKSWKIYLNYGNNKQRFYQLYDDLKYDLKVIDKKQEVQSLQKQIISDPAVVAHMLLDMKSEIFKLRDQVQNLTQQLEQTRVAIQPGKESISTGEGFTIFTRPKEKAVEPEFKQLRL